MTAVYWITEYLATFFETIMACLFVSTFINGEDDRHRKLITLFGSLICAALIIIENSFDLFSFFNVVLLIFLYCALQYIIYQKQLGLTVVLILIYVIVCSDIDGVVLMTLSTVGLEPEFLLNQQSVYRIAAIIASKLLLFIIIYLIHKLGKHKIQFHKKYMIAFCVIAIILESTVFLMMNSASLFSNNELKIFSIIFFIVSATLIILIFSLIIRLTENFNQKQEISLLELQNQMVVKAERDTEQAFKLWRNSIHDYKHKIIALKEWVNDGDLEAIKSFVDNENDLMNQKMFYVKTGNSVVDAIVNTKRNLAEEKGICFGINAVMPEDYHISEMDLVCILGNLIDNAIEASESQVNPRIEVTIKQVKNFLIIKITNSFTGELPEDNQTTKKNSEFHGIGLKSVKKIVDKYNGNYEMSKKEDNVITTVMIPNN